MAAAVLREPVALAARRRRFLDALSHSCSRWIAKNPLMIASAVVRQANGSAGSGAVDEGRLQLNVAGDGNTVERRVSGTR